MCACRACCSVQGCAPCARVGRGAERRCGGVAMLLCIHTVRWHRWWYIKHVVIHAVRWCRRWYIEHVVHVPGLPATRKVTECLGCIKKPIKIMLARFHMVVPTPKSPQTVPINHSPNPKPLLPHLNARYLIVYLNHWHFSGNWYPGGLCGARCIVCTHFGRKKVHFWTCTDQPLLQDISIINVI